MNYWIIGILMLSLIPPIFYMNSMLVGQTKSHRVARLIVRLAAILWGTKGNKFVQHFGHNLCRHILNTRNVLLVMSGIYGVGGTSQLDI